MEKANWENSDRSLSQDVAKVTDPNCCHGWARGNIAKLTDVNPHVKDRLTEKKDETSSWDKWCSATWKYPSLARETILTVSLNSCGTESLDKFYISIYAKFVLSCSIHSKEFMSQKRVGLDICLAWRATWWKFATQEYFLPKLLTYHDHGKTHFLFIFQDFSLIG